MELLGHLRTVLIVLDVNWFVANEKKRTFGQNHVEYFGSCDFTGGCC